MVSAGGLIVNEVGKRGYLRGCGVYFHFGISWGRESKSGPCLFVFSSFLVCCTKDVAALRENGRRRRAFIEVPLAYWDSN